MRVAVAVLVASCSLGTGCQEPSGSEGFVDHGSCVYEEREVSLDAMFGDETPRAVIELLERPVAGAVTWYGGEGEYVDVVGVAGPSEFEARAVAGPVVRVREGAEGQGGVQEERILCMTQFLFDVAVHFETADGALNEDWNGQGTYDVSGTLGATGSLQVVVQDPRPFTGTLEVTEHAEVVDDWKSRELLVMLNFATQPLDFVGMQGMIRYNLANIEDGGGEGELVAVTIAEFAFPPNAMPGW